VTPLASQGSDDWSLFATLETGDRNHLADHIERGGSITHAMREFLVDLLRDGPKSKRLKARPKDLAKVQRDRDMTDFYWDEICKGQSRKDALEATTKKFFKAKKHIYSEDDTKIVKRALEIFTLRDVGIFRHFWDQKKLGADDGAAKDSAATAYKVTVQDVERVLLRGAWLKKKRPRKRVARSA